MLKADYHKQFLKDYRRLPKSIRPQFKKRLKLFLENPKNPVLRDHALSGLLKGRRAFSVTGDLRIVYRFVTPDFVVLLRLGTHNQIY